MTPADEMPEPDPKRPFVPLVYFAGKSLFDLSTGDYYRFLADFPKALLWKLRLENIASDAHFYYCRELRFEDEWALARFPENNHFEPHAVWHRKPGSDWVLDLPDATLASPR